MKISEPTKNTRRPKQAFCYYIWEAFTPEPLTKLSFNCSTIQPLDSIPEKGGETTKYYYFPEFSLFTKSINLS